MERGHNACNIEDENFRAEFDGPRWAVEYFWIGGPPKLRNRVNYYKHTMRVDVKNESKREVDRLTEMDILGP